MLTGCEKLWKLLIEKNMKNSLFMNKSTKPMMIQGLCFYKSEIEAEAKSNTSYNFDDSPIESVSSSYMIQIPFAEYQDLRHKALQYDMVIGALRQCT